MFSGILDGANQEAISHPQPIAFLANPNDEIYENTAIFKDTLQHSLKNAFGIGEEVSCFADVDTVLNYMQPADDGRAVTNRISIPLNLGDGIRINKAVVPYVAEGLNVIIENTDLLSEISTVAYVTFSSTLPAELVNQIQQLGADIDPVLIVINHDLKNDGFHAAMKGFGFRAICYLDLENPGALSDLFKYLTLRTTYPNFRRTAAIDRGVYNQNLTVNSFPAESEVSLEFLIQESAIFTTQSASAMHAAVIREGDYNVTQNEALLKTIGRRYDSRVKPKTPIKNALRRFSGAFYSPGAKAHASSDEAKADNEQARHSQNRAARRGSGGGSVDLLLGGVESLEL